MRIAALYDIHGNLPALEAVLAEVRAAGVDHVVVGGDVVGGPMTREVFARLLNLDLPTQFIHGNAESAVLALLSGGDPGKLPEQAREIIGWEARQLAEYEHVLRSWPLTVRLDIPPIGEVLFCHATPRNDTEIFTRLTADDRLLPVFEGVTASLVVCGHTHMQHDRTLGRLRVVNAGSIGMPFGPPGADWLLLGPDVELRHTMYDLAAAAEGLRRIKYPNAEEFARSILHPRTEEETLELFAPAMLR